MFAFNHFLRNVKLCILVYSILLNLGLGDVFLTILGRLIEKRFSRVGHNHGRSSYVTKLDS